MVELNEREQKIVLIKFMMHNDGPFSKLPMNVRETMLATSCKLLGFEYDKDAMLDLGQAVLDVQKKVNVAGTQFMNVNADTVNTALKYLNLGKDKKLS